MPNISLEWGVTEAKSNGVGTRYLLS